MEEKREGRKSEKRKEEGGWEGKAGWVPLGPGQRQRGPQVRLREAVPSTTTGWRWRPQLALDRRSQWAGLGQAWEADPGCSQPSSLQAKGEGRCGPVFGPLGIGFCQLTP